MNLELSFPCPSLSIPAVSADAAPSTMANGSSRTQTSDIETRGSSSEASRVLQMAERSISDTQVVDESNSQSGKGCNQPGCK